MSQRNELQLLELQYTTTLHDHKVQGLQATVSKLRLKLCTIEDDLSREKMTNQIIQQGHKMPTKQNIPHTSPRIRSHAR